MSVKSILKGWLTEHGYDGLVGQDMDCGCFVDDLFTCYSYPGKCAPSYHRECCDCPIFGCSMRSDGIGCFHSEKLAKDGE